MITTKDGVVKKRGERVYERALNIRTGLYEPTVSFVHSRSNGVHFPDRCWSTRDLCQSECDERNKEIKTEKDE